MVFFLNESTKKTALSSRNEEVGDAEGEKKPVGIDDLLGHALGCVGLSLDDFCRLTPVEFEAVCKAWHMRHEDEMHDSRERMRMSATIAIQPHIKGKMTPERLLPFPWEKSKKKAEAPKVSAEEARKRFERLISREY